jgi:hypothetical protein
MFARGIEFLAAGWLDSLTAGLIEFLSTGGLESLAADWLETMTVGWLESMVFFSMLSADSASWGASNRLTVPVEVRKQLLFQVKVCNRRMSDCGKPKTDDLCQGRSQVCKQLIIPDRELLSIYVKLIASRVVYVL